MKKNLSTKSVHNRASRRRHMQPNKADTGIQGSLVDFQPEVSWLREKKGATLAVVGVVLVALVIAFLFAGGVL